MSQPIFKAPPVPKVLIVTTVPWSCAERIAGSLAGIEVEAVFPAGHPIATSRHVQRTYPYRALTPLSALRHAIDRAEPDLVVPCEDRAARYLAALHAKGQFRPLLARSLGAPQRFSEMFDRRRFMAEAAKAGVRTAQMLPAASLAQFEAAIEAFGLPLVIKRDSTWGGEGVVIARTRAEAIEAWQRLSRKPSRLRQLVRAFKRHDLHFLADMLKPADPVVGVQRHIPGLTATSSFFCWRGEVLGANHFVALATAHETGPASVLSHQDCPEMEDAVRRIARHFGLSGLVGLDFIRDHDGRAYLIEINPRATPTSHLALGPGHDPCQAMLAKLGRPAPRPAVTDAREIALFPQEWRRDPQSPYLTRAYHDVPRDEPALVRALLNRAAQSRPGLNDDLAAEMGKLGLGGDWDGSPLTIHQLARQ